MTNTTPAHTPPEHPPRIAWAESSQDRAKSIQLLTRVTTIVALLALATFLILYLRDSNWQLLMMSVIITLVLVCIVLATIEQRKQNFSRAGTWLILGIVIPYCATSLLWEGMHLEIGLSGALLIILVGSITMPQYWKRWALLLALFEICVWILNSLVPTPRFEGSDRIISTLIFFTTVLVLLGNLWYVIQLGGRVSHLQDFVDDLRKGDRILRRQLDELKLLHALAVAGTEASSEDELVERATDLIGKALKPDRFGVLLLDPITHMLNLHTSYHTSGDAQKIKSIAIGTGITGKVAADGKPRRIADTSQDRDYLEINPQTRSELCVPLKIGGDVIGVINTESNQIGTFTEADERLFTTFAGQLATAIDRLRNVAAATQRSQQLSTIYDVGRRITSILTLNQLLPEVVHLIATTLNLYNVEIALIEGDNLVFHAGCGGYTDAGFLPGEGIRIGEGITGQAAEAGKTILVPDISVCGDYIPQDALPHIQSELAIPLQVKNETIGVLDVKSDTYHGLTQEDATVLETLASQVTVAIQNARFFEALQEQKQELSSLYEAALVTNSILDPKTLLGRLYEQVQHLLAPDLFVAALYNEQTQTLTIPMAMQGNIPLPSSQGLAIPLSEGGLTGWVIQTRETLLINDLQAEHNLPIKPRYTGRSRAWLGVPLIIGERLIGALSVQSFQPNAFQESHQRFFESLASQVAVALENARLYKTARERNAELEALRQASLQVASSLELKPVLEAIMENALKLVRANDAHIFLYDGVRLKFGAARWAGEIQHEPYASPREHGVTYSVARTGKRLVISDTKSHPLFVDDPWDGAIIGLPLRVGDQVIGVMNIAFNTSHMFDEDELRALELLADQAAVALRNAELFEAANRQLKELTILHTVATIGAEATNEDTIIEKATEIIGHTLYPDQFGILLLDELEQSLNFHPSYRGISEAARARPISLGTGITGTVAKDAQPWLVGDVTQENVYIAANKGMFSELCVPLKIDDRIIGVVNAESSQKYAFTSNDQRLLSTLAGQLATAIEKQRLFAETIEALTREQRLNEVARTISGALDLNTILRNVVRLAAELVGAEAGALAMLTSEGKLAYRHLFNLPAELENLSQSIDQSASWKLIESQQSLLITEYRNYPHARPELIKAGVQSFIGVPVLVGGDPIGALGLFSMAHHNTFSDRDLALLEAIGLQAGIAIQNAQLFAEVEARATDLSNALVQLQELDKLKSQFIQNVSHELRTPLAIARGYAELLENGTLGELREEQKQPVEIIHRRIKMLVSMVEGLTAILEAETQRIKMETVDLLQLVRNTMEEFEITAQEASITLVKELDVTEAQVLGAPVRLRQVLDNLLGNALKFTPTDGIITVRLQEKSDAFIMEVSDTGIGIPENELTRIFERFYQVDGSAKRRYPGTGLGLALVKEITEAHGGSVSVESVLGQGSTFRVILPSMKD